MGAISGASISATQVHDPWEDLQHFKITTQIPHFTILILDQYPWSSTLLGRHIFADQRLGLDKVIPVLFHYILHLLHQPFDLSGRCGTIIRQ